MLFCRTFSIVFFIALTSFCDVSAQNKSFRSSEGSFTIALPAKPTSETQSEIPESKPGGKLFTWVFEDELIAFAVSYADSISAMPGEEKERVGRAADGLVEAFQSRGDTLIARRDVTLGEIPGVEVKYRKKEHTLLDRYFMVGSRLYSIMGICVTGPKEARVLKTIDSFQIIK